MEIDCVFLSSSNKINSPIQLESSEDERSYLSLQAPLGRSIDDTIQFETLDIYIWTGPGFRSPALLFYAGPTYFQDEDDISSAEMDTEVRGDWNKINVHWQLALL